MIKNKIIPQDQLMFSISLQDRWYFFLVCKHVHRCNSLLWKTKVKVENKNWFGRIFCCVASTSTQRGAMRTPLFLLVCRELFNRDSTLLSLYVLLPFHFSFSLLHRHIDAFSRFSYPSLVPSWLPLNPSISIIDPK